MEIDLSSLTEAQLQDDTFISMFSNVNITIDVVDTGAAIGQLFQTNITVDQMQFPELESGNFPRLNLVADVDSSNLVDQMDPTMTAFPADFTSMVLTFEPPVQGLSVPIFDSDFNTGLQISEAVRVRMFDMSNTLVPATTTATDTMVLAGDFAFNDGVMDSIDDPGPTAAVRSTTTSAEVAQVFLDFGYIAFTNTVNENDFVRNVYPASSFVVCLNPITPSASPSEVPSSSPTSSQSPTTQTGAPSSTPTARPSTVLSQHPSSSPSESPSETPSESPSNTQAPTRSTDAPSSSPSNNPSDAQSHSPSASPSDPPSGTPSTSQAPTSSTGAPSESPSD